MGGEWDKMGVMDEAEVVYISGDDGVNRIYPPKGYRKHIIELTHKGGKHVDIVLATCSMHYRWPKMKQEIKQHISNCRTCFKHKPAKTEAKHSGLVILIEDLSPMDWLSTDLMEIKDKSGKKSSYLIIVDRASAFIRAYNLPGTKTKNIIASLEEFVEVYYGPPLLLTSDSRPQFGAANKAITE